MQQNIQDQQVNEHLFLSVITVENNVIRNKKNKFV